jgi:hypothetical protein
VVAGSGKAGRWRQRSESGAKSDNEEEAKRESSLPAHVW